MTICFVSASYPQVELPKWRNDKRWRNKAWYPQIVFLLITSEMGSDTCSLTVRKYTRLEFSRFLAEKAVAGELRLTLQKF